jgi:hypothetical protein
LAATEVLWEVALRAPVQGLTFVAVVRLHKEGVTMMEEIEWFVGIDWASKTHQACLIDAGGKIVGERAFDHDGAGLAALCAWLLSMTGAEPAAIAVAIEVPHGPIVETLLERGFPVYAINPKQLDRFRDRFTVAGAKSLPSRQRGTIGGTPKSRPTACAPIATPSGACRSTTR